VHSLELTKNNNNDTQTIPKPKILPLTNGPYYLINDMQPSVVENLENSKRQPLSTIRGVALCRCGASYTKPFCDGTHGIIRWSSENRVDDVSNKIRDKRKEYVGKDITIHDNRRLCSHAAECVNNLKSVFRENDRPWIDPDAASPEAIIETIRKCPSGALSYSINGSENRDPPYNRSPMVTVSKDGPYAVSGGIELIGNEIRFGEGASKEHYTLCRCGASYTKPFCDGTHSQIKFKDEKN
jgi:CDGSH-type Zn-finger protein